MAKRKGATIRSLAITHAAALAAVLTIAAPQSARISGDTRHTIFALTAERLLTPAARQQGKALLAADADPLIASDLAARRPGMAVVDGTAAYRLDIIDHVPPVQAARQQLGRAGVRVAVLLNAAFR